MANNWSKEERVAFEQLVEGFDDELVIARNVSKYVPMGPREMERTNDRLWRPMPYIPAVYDGFDQSANFGDITQLSVPVSVNNVKSSNGKMTPTDLRDPLQLNRYFEQAKMSLSSAINLSTYTTAANWGSLVVARPNAASGFDDLAAASAVMTEQGVPSDSRKAFYTARDYLSMAGTIAKPETSANALVNPAYQRAFVRQIGNFQVFENDQSIRLLKATATGVTITNAQPLYYTPKAVTVDIDGNPTNVDNRTQTISIAVTSGTVKVGDAFTIAGVNSLHHISKQDTGQPKTFRVVEIVTGNGGTGTVKITPPIISNGGNTKAELEYKNVSATPANGAALTFLNVQDANVNPFFHESAVELIPGTFVVEPADGWQVLRATTPLGVGITYTRQGNINDLSMKFRIDVRYGVAALNPEMMGVELFGQTP